VPANDRDSFDQAAWAIHLKSSTSSVVFPCFNDDLISEGRAQGRSVLKRFVAVQSHLRVDPISLYCLSVQC
jgi:hypothetical protein